MTGGPVVTEKEIRELIGRMERAARLRRDNGSLRTAEVFDDCADMLKDLLEEHSRSAIASGIARCANQGEEPCALT